MTIIEIIKTYELEELGVEIKDKAGDYIILQSANIWSQYVNPKDEIMQKRFYF